MRIDSYQPGLLRESVLRVLKEPSFREKAASLGEIIRSSQGTSEAVEWILTRIEEKQQEDFSHHSDSLPGVRYR